MDIGSWTQDGEWSATPELNRIYREIRELGLESNLAELEAFGFTVIENALSPSLTETLRDSIVRISEKRLGKSLDIQKETDHNSFDFIPYLLFQGEEFEQALLTRNPLALMTYLMGESCWVSSTGSHLKGPGETGLVLHSDNGNGQVPPFPAFSQVANCNYALTDYSKDDGALAMVPGSHRLARPPQSHEMSVSEGSCYKHAIPVEVPAGSAVIWHGNTWHGSFPRKNPGLRINYSTYFCRQYIAPQEVYYNNIPDGFLQRHGADSRMAQLIGLNRYNGWQEEGPDMGKMRVLPAGKNWYA